MGESEGSSRPRGPAAPSCLVALLLSVLVSISACAAPHARVRLTDAQLDKIGAGEGLCAAFGIQGSCVVSSVTVFDPFLPPSSDPACGTLPGTNRQCVECTQARPIPASGGVTLIQSLTAGGSSVSQTNSVSGEGSMSSLGRLPYWMHGQGPYLVPLLPMPR